MLAFFILSRHATRRAAQLTIDFYRISIQR